MALETVVVQQDHFGYTTNDLYDLLGGNWNCHDLGGLLENEQVYGSFHLLGNQTENSHWNSPPPSLVVPCLDITSNNQEEFSQLDTLKTTVSTRPKRRRRLKSKKNEEEMENQRMTHIAVERNRRKQMNEYLSLLRGLMPHSYVQKGDQASIVGGAINYVKELEQKLHFLGGRKHWSEAGSSSSSSLPFDEFFTYPQYSTRYKNSAMVSENELAVADIEVTMVESHASLKIRSKRRPKQLLKLVSGLQSLRLTIFHLNVTTVDQVVLYSLNLKVEDDCKLTSVDEIANAVNLMLARIQDEAV